MDKTSENRHDDGLDMEGTNTAKRLTMAARDHG
jgi:hypothetical protein